MGAGPQRSGPVPATGRLLPPLPDELQAEEVDKVFASLLADLVGGEARTLVKLCVRQAVQQLVPTKTNAVDGGVYSQLFAVLLLEAVAAEARIVVGEAVQEVANDYVARRGAERVVESMLEELMTDECGPIAEGARIEVVADSLLDDAMEPIVSEVAVAALHEARGVAARRREAEDRRLVTKIAADCLLDRLCMQRLLQHLSTQAEVLLLQRVQAQLLDELIAEGLGRRALSVHHRALDLYESAVFSEVHQRIAYGALMDEMLAQLRVLSASGLEAGVPRLPSETDTDDDDDEPLPPPPATVKR